jgi:hypothetical protein
MEYISLVQKHRILNYVYVLNNVLMNWYNPCTIFGGRSLNAVIVTQIYNSHTSRLVSKKFNDKLKSTNVIFGNQNMNM